jgi:uncharacterized membrane protein YqjE
VETIVQLGVAAIELIEAEGRLLRRQLLRVGLAAGMGVIMLALALAGLVFLLMGCFMMLARVMPSGWAALAVAGCTWAIAGIGLLWIQRMLR